MRVNDDRFAAVVTGFLKSQPFSRYAPATRDLWGRALTFMARPDCLGAVAITEIRPALVQAYFDVLEGGPYKAAAALTALKALEKWAVARDILPRQITIGVEIPDPDGGHIPWTDEQVELAERHARPDLARAVTLAACTGQRGSDLVRMGPTDVEVYEGREGIRVRQVKTGRQVWVPITGRLAEAIATWERTPGPWLRRPDGRPWGRLELTQAWRWERDHNHFLAPLRLCGPDKDKPLVLHGLRGFACVSLLRAGCNTRQISDVVGMSEPMVAKYTRFSSQQENAAAAILNLEEMRHRKNDMAKYKSLKSGA